MDRRSGFLLLALTACAAPDDRAMPESASTASSRSDDARNRQATEPTRDAAASGPPGRPQVATEAGPPARPEAATSPETAAVPPSAAEPIAALAERLARSDRDAERALRERLADGPDAFEAGLALVDWMISQEFHGDAVAVADALLAGDLSLAERDVTLLLKARLFFDLARWGEGRGLLLQLIATRPGLTAAQFELFRVERARKDIGAARDAIEAVAARDDVWTRAHRLDIDRHVAEMEVAAQRGVVDHTGVEMLAIVRGGPTVASRATALRALLAAPATRPTACRVGLLQDEGILRTYALRALARETEDFAVIVDQALAEDPDSRVRGAAATRAKELPKEQAIRLLVRHLDAEEDPYAFGRTHAALTELVGPLPGVPLEPDTARATVRERLAKDWRQRCPE